MAAPAQSLSIPCSIYEENLVLYHYGDLAVPEGDSLKSHLEGCAGCAAYLAELQRLMPLTLKADDPPEIFWSNYNRELRAKLDDAAAKPSWRQRLAFFFQPPWLPVFATAAVVVLALTFTLGRVITPTQSPAPVDEALLEALPMAENLEFFRAMDVLDEMELLEFMGGPWNSKV